MKGWLVISTTSSTCFSALVTLRDIQLVDFVLDHSIPSRYCRLGKPLQTTGRTFLCCLDPNGVGFLCGSYLVWLSGRDSSLLVLIKGPWVLCSACCVLDPGRTWLIQVTWEMTCGWKQVVMNRSLIWKKGWCTFTSKAHHWIQLTLAVFIQSLFFFLFLKKLVEKIVGIQKADYLEIFSAGFYSGLQY